RCSSRTHGYGNVFKEYRFILLFFTRRRRHTRSKRDWSSDVCSSDLNRAKKIGLHFSNHPKLSNQHSTILISVGDYYFHILPEKQDFEELDHLGALDENYRNPRTRMSLSHAKKIIYQYINWRPTKPKRHLSQRKYSSAYYTPSSLGKMEWPPHKPHRMR